MRTLIVYNWEEELEDYVNQLENGDSTEGHIFIILVALDNFITRKNNSALWIVRSKMLGAK